MSQEYLSNQQPATDNATYRWYISLYEKYGNLWVSWSSDAPFRTAESKFYIFSDIWPVPPENPVWECWVDDNTGSEDTGLLWGSNWYGALVAQVGSLGSPYTYVVQAGPTSGD